MRPFLKITRDEALAILVIDRPEERNAITSDEQIDEFVGFCSAASADPTLKAVVITGAGTAFCAGGNVRSMHAREGMFAAAPYDLRNRYRAGIQRIPIALTELEVPIVAAINGPAIGAGLDLACMCDVRVASIDATFAESFVKLGIIPGDGGAWLLPRVIGPARAALMTLTGDPIDAPKALEYGLVTAVVPPSELLPLATDIARRIASNPGHATRLAKRLMREGQDMKLGPLLELSAAYQALAHHTHDHAEAVAAFIGKRRPEFTDL